MLQFKHRGLQRLLFLFWKSRSRIVFHTKVWSLLLPDSSRYLKEVLPQSPSSRSKQTQSLSSHYIGGRTSQSSPSYPGFPLQHRTSSKLLRVQTLLPTPLPSSFTGSLQSCSLNQSLLPYHCLPPSLTSSES